jgi:hypothetical protein
VTGTVNDILYQGMATGTLTVNKINVTVTLNNLSQSYNGSARSVTAATVPAGLMVTITYDGNSCAPTNPGTYSVSAVVNESCYQGTANGTLAIVFAAPSASKGSFSDHVLVYWDVISTATACELWRGTDANVQNASLLANCSGTIYLDNAVTPDVVYYYWIRALTPGGVIGYSQAGYGYCGTIANLSSPAGVSASDGGYADRIRISWQAVTSATRYEVWRNTEDNRSSASRISEPATTSSDDFSVAPGVSYYYWIKARSASRDGDFSASDAGWTRLGTPAGVNATDAAFPYHIRVDWNAVANAAWYEIWREEVPGVNSSGGNLVKIAQTGGVYYNDYETRSGVYYKYKVRSFNGLSSSLDYGHDTGFRQINSASMLLPAVNDYDGDRLSDPALFIPQRGALDVLCSALGRRTFTTGLEHSMGVSGDYDGDRLADPVAYSPDSGLWLTMLSSAGYSPLVRTVFGGNGAGPVAADFDGDGLADMAVYDETGGYLSARLSNGGMFDLRAACAVGGPGWRYISGDFDGDGLADPAAYSESESRMTVLFSGNNYSSAVTSIGGAGRNMFAADFDGDGLADPALYEQATGLWVILLSGINYAEARISLGGTGYMPAAGDYDGDGKSDPAVYREADGRWLIMLSASAYASISENFGGPGSQPLTRSSLDKK